MNREIKFRAWLKEEQKIYNWEPTFFSDMSPVTRWSSEFPETEEDVVLMQYTRLKDKNGKEIYEGDIVRTVSDYDNGWKSDHYDFTGEVVWADDWAGWVQKNYGPIGSILDGSTTIEVIGSVYENPELLEDL